MILCNLFKAPVALFYVLLSFSILCVFMKCALLYVQRYSSCFNVFYVSSVLLLQLEISQEG